MKANRKTIAIIIATLVLVAAATTGVVMYLNDDGTSRAGFDENEPSISDVNTNPGSTEENNQGENDGNTENPANNNEPGNLPEAGENENQGTTANRGGTTGANTNQGTITTTSNANVPNQEYVTERVEKVERQITEDLLVGWTPLSITSAYSTNKIGIYKPDLEIVKVSSTTDGNNSVAAGDALTYAMAVKNNGNEDITGLTISDVIPEQTTFIEGTIYGNGTYNKELNKIVWKVDVKAGEVVAVGFAVTLNENATGTIKNVGTIDGKNTEEVVNPVITSEKLAEVYRDKQPIEGPANIGDQIKYTIVAKNTGDVDATVVMKDTIPANTKLVSPIEVAGEEIDEATMNVGKNVTVPAGETVELTFTVEIKAVEGSIKNIATVGTTIPDTETKTANLEMTKTVSDKINGEYSKNVTLKVGETAYFKIELKNTGSEDLEVTMKDIMNDKKITLYDGDKAIAQTVTVPAGTTKTLTATYKMQQEDIDNQQRLKNTATATTPVTPGNEDTAEVTPEKAEPGIEVEKTATSVNGGNITTETKAVAGDKVVYTIVVTNTGNVTLHNVVVTDDLVSSFNETIESLAPGANKTYTVEYEVTQNDVDTKATIVNTATATDGTTTGTDTDETIPTDKTPGIEVEKTATLVNGKAITSETKVAAGDKITYTIVVTNNGKVTLHNVVVTDSLKVKYNGNEIDPAQNGILRTIESLAPRASETYTVEYEVTQNDVDTKATIVNTAMATDGTTTGTDTDETIPTDKTPEIEVEKTATLVNGKAITNATRVRAGDEVTYQIVVTNTGKVTLHNVEVTDDLVSSFKETIESLAPNASETYTVEYTVTQADVDNKAQIENTAIATDGITTGTDTDETVPTDKTPGIAVEKTATKVNGEDITKNTKVRAGDVITYTITVANTGKITLKDVKVIDKELNINYNGTEIAAGSPIDTISSLAPNASETYTVEYTVTQADVDNKAQIENTAIATDGTTTDEKPSNPVPVNPNITLTGTKFWNDNENQDGVRPDNITIAVISSNKTDKTERLQTIGKNQDGIYNWAYEFTGLPKYDSNGNEINYSVTETGIDENYYTSKPEQVIKDDNGNFVANITNEHTPATISLTVTKHWNDSNNQDGFRPTSITIKVKDEQNNIVGTEELNGDLTTNDWTKVLFNDLPKYKEGKQINYTIIEEITTNADKYTASEPRITVDSSTGNITAEITNTHTPETVTISGTKNWVGDNETQRPESITVRLMNGTTEVTSKNVNAEDNWKYDFGAQPKYANGKEIKYTIKEDSVEGYITTTTGYNITNTYVKPTLTISKTSDVGAKVKLGDEIKYIITAKNTGKVTAKSVIITDEIPVNTTLKEGTISDNGVNNNGTITWNIASLAVGESKSVSFKVTVNNSADVIGKKITNTGYVNGDPTNETTTTVSKTIAITKKEYPAKSIDVVLVLDISSSMNEIVTAEKTRIDHAKEATCKFIDEIFPEGTRDSGSTITVITFNNKATKIGKATNDTSAITLKKNINSITIPEGKGTNVEAGLELANNELDKLNNKDKFVVFLGDGAPTPAFIIQEDVQDRYGVIEWYVKSSFSENTEENITSQANQIKAKTTGVYAVGVGINDLLDEREYWSHYIRCTKENCNDPHHVIVNDRREHNGEGYHWESQKVYAKRVLKDIIADKDNGDKKYYHTVEDNTQTIIDQFTKVLQSITTTTSTVKAEGKTVKIPVTGGTVNTTRNIAIKIGGEAFECKISELPKYGVSYTKTSSEEYFTWDLTDYAMENLEIEYTIK